MLDVHVHPRRATATAFDHIEGSGVARAVLLSNLRDADRAKGEIAGHPGRFLWFLPPPIRAVPIEDGARGIGEMKNHVAADSPEMRKVYDLAAEMNVPVLIHFQEVPHFAGEGDFNTGFRQFDRMLKTHAKTTFIGHADFFWANISAEVPTDTGYPPGSVKPGGLTDRWLADFPNLYGDLSANSGHNALIRDADFMRGFLARHQNKLFFGSDCSCRDGKRTGGSPLLPQLKGKCVARATLEAAQKLAKPEVFRKITWENGLRLLKGESVI